MRDAPRSLRPAPTPLGLYVRPGRNDHTTLQQLSAERVNGISGVVFDPCLGDRHKDLRESVLRDGLEAVLDPRSVELATAGGLERSGMRALPWMSGDEPQTPADLVADSGLAFVETLVQRVIRDSYTAVLAPSHYLASADDPWLEVDSGLVRQLRHRLNANGRAHAPIYFPLVLPASVFRDRSQRARLIDYLRTLPIDSIWLRVHNFGSTAGAQNLRGYIEACQDLHTLEVPLVAEYTGTLGPSLLAVGAVGGTETGVTLGESFDMGRLVSRPRPDSTPFAQSPRVYIPKIGAFLDRRAARAFFESRVAKTQFGCRDQHCCRDGWEGMLSDPRRHFLIQRISEVGRLGRAPASLRPGLHLDEFLRPATDLALRAARIEPKLENHRKRLESRRLLLGALQRDGAFTSFALPPEGQVLSHVRAARPSA